MSHQHLVASSQSINSSYFHFFFILIDLVAQSFSGLYPPVICIIMLTLRKYLTTVMSSNSFLSKTAEMCLGLTKDLGRRSLRQKSSCWFIAEINRSRCWFLVEIPPDFHLYMVIQINIYHNLTHSLTHSLTH